MLITHMFATSEDRNEPHTLRLVRKELLAHVYLIKWLYDGGGGGQLELIRIM